MESLTREREALRKQLEEETERIAETERALETATTRAEEAEGYCRRMESDIERTHRDAELQEFRAVARERAKWEEREARLVQRIKKLERGAVVVSRNTKQVEREDSSGLLQRERSQRHPAAQEERRSPRYAVTTVTSGCEQERGKHRESVNYPQPSDVSSSKAGAAGQAHLQPVVLSSCPSPLPYQIGAAHAQSGGPYQTSLRPDVPAFVPLGPQHVA